MSWISHCAMSGVSGARRIGHPRQTYTVWHYLQFESGVLTSTGGWDYKTSGSQHITHAPPRPHTHTHHLWECRIFPMNFYTFIWKRTYVKNVSLLMERYLFCGEDMCVHFVHCSSIRIRYGNRLCILYSTATYECTITYFRLDSYQIWVYCLHL